MVTTTADNTCTPSPAGTERSDASSSVTSITSASEQLGDLNLSQDQLIASSPSIYDVLNDAVILITGGAGFVGAALVHRLLCDPKLNIKQLICIVRGDTVEEATGRLPKNVQHLVQPQQEGALPKLAVVNGDCSRPDFGLDETQFEKVRKTQIVIHCAGDTRFTLPFNRAFGSIADLAYMSARFSLLTWNVKTHIHVSTTFVGWYMPTGSIVTETMTPQCCSSQVDEHGLHVNTYFQAKTYAEACVNSLFTAQSGRSLHGKTCRIVRLATLGPAVEFPRSAWGSVHPSSPVCAAVAAERTDPKNVCDGAGLDVIPVDLAVNQILALTASAHALQSLPTSHLLHPKNPKNIINTHNRDIPIYHVACGRDQFSKIPIDLINSPDVKIENPYIPEKNLLKVYKPFLNKVVDFDVYNTRRILGLKPLEADSDRVKSDSTKTIHLSGIPVSIGSLDTDILETVGRKWSDDGCGGWKGYLQMVRDSMEAMGPRSDWETFVD